MNYLDVLVYYFGLFGKGRQPGTAPQSCWHCPQSVCAGSIRDCPKAGGVRELIPGESIATNPSGVLWDIWEPSCLSRGRLKDLHFDLLGKATLGLHGMFHEVCFTGFWQKRLWFNVGFQKVGIVEQLLWL